MDKANLRKKLKAERSKLSADEVQTLSQRITDGCLEILNMLSISSLHIYLPEKRLKEVDASLLVEKIKLKWPEVKIAYAPFAGPVKFKSLWLKDGSDVRDNYRFDLIIVPQLGFDNQGYRLGYGGGYYDQFLAKQKKAEVIGLCYEFGHLKSLPHEPHDIPIKTVVTERKVYIF